MIVNNHNSQIGTQNNLEVHATSASVIDLLQQISIVLDADKTLGKEELARAKAIVTESTRAINDGSSTKQTIYKSLGALAGIGSVASLVSKFTDLF